MHYQETHPVSEDKDGKEVSNTVSIALMELRDKTRNYQVVCHYHATGRIGLWAKGPNITSEHVEIARECGYQLDHATTRKKKGKKRGYAEFTPENNEWQ
jgi:hypothetical protein